MKKSVLFVLISLLCVIVSVCAAVCAFFITRALAPETPVKIENENDDKNPLTVKTLAINEMSVSATSASETSLTKILTVTSTPSNADFEVEWSAAFKNPSSTWATGKSVSDYITITPGVNVKAATIRATKAFGEQIIITAAVKNNTNLKATCLCDYRKEIKTFNLVLGGTTYNNFSIASTGLTNIATISAGTALYTSFADATYGDGTLTPSSSPTVSKVQLVVEASKFYNYLNLRFAGESLPDIASAVKSGTYDLHSKASNGVYMYKNLNSLYTLFYIICGGVTEDEESDVKRIAVKMNDALKGNATVEDPNTRYPATIPGLTFKYTLSDSTTLTVPVKYIYNPNFSVS